MVTSLLRSRIRTNYTFSACMCLFPSALSFLYPSMSTQRYSLSKLRFSSSRAFSTSTGPAYTTNLPPPAYQNFGFDILHKSSTDDARLGLLTTPHGEVRTPAFIFCGTKAAVKGLTPDMVRDAGSQIILSNTYHLFLQPGSETIQKLGGLQRVTGWKGPMLTDSGGYQIFSMGHGSVSDEIKGRRGKNGATNSGVVRIDEQAAVFRSYLDGAIKTLTPELSIQTQRQLGADLIVVLDECTPFHVDKDYTASSMRRSHRWGIRSLNEFIRGDDGSQALYGIIQGGVYEDLRKESANFVMSTPFFGTAIGGSLGSVKAMMHDIVSYTSSLIKSERPVHLLGIGGVQDIFHGVRCGIDTFDCVHPTRLGRHGGALVMAHYWEEPNRKERNVKEHIAIGKSWFKDDSRPIDETCGCYTCKNFSRGYLHHLHKAGESLSGTLLSLHNVYFMNRMMSDIREGIRLGTLTEVETRYIHPSLADGEQTEVERRKQSSTTRK